MSVYSRLVLHLSARRGREGCKYRSFLLFIHSQTGQLNEFTERRKLDSEVICMSLGTVPAGEQRCRFLALGLIDGTVRIVSLNPTDCLLELGLQALPKAAESVCIVEIGSGAESERQLSSHEGGLFLYIGLQNGVLLRTALDPIKGQLSDTRTRYVTESQ